jgi:hypothetical protein
VLILSFVMVVEAVVFIPLIANFRRGWLSERLVFGHSVALMLSSAPIDAAAADVARDALAGIDIYAITETVGQKRIQLATSYYCCLRCIMVPIWIRMRPGGTPLRRQVTVCTASPTSDLFQLMSSLWSMDRGYVQQWSTF